MLKFWIALSPWCRAFSRIVPVACCLAASLIVLVEGQSPAYARIIGRVILHAEARNVPSEMIRVVLTDRKGAMLAERSPSPDGSFDLGRVRYGQYVVTVSSPGFQTVSQVVDVPLRSYNVEVQIALGPRVSPEGAAGPVEGDETVSVASLKIPQKAQKELDKGRQRLGKGNAEKAVRHFQKALELCSGCYQAQAGLGSSYLILGRWQEAEGAFDKLIELDPQNPALRRQLAQTYLRQKAFEKALEQLKMILGMEPKSGETMVLLGEAYLGIQDCGTALNYFKTASQMDPGEHSCLGLGRSYYCNGRNIEALSEFKEFVELNPTDPRTETVLRFIVDLEKAIRTGGSR